MKNGNKAVITGMGAITPMGCSVEEIQQSLERAEPALKDITLFDCPGLATKQAAEITGFKAADYLGAKGLRSIPRSGKLLMSALKLLAQDTGVPSDEAGNRVFPDDRIGLVLGSTFGSVESISSFDREALVEPQYVNPMAFPNTVINAVAGYAAIRYGIRSFTVTVSNGFISGTDALGMAAEFMAAGRAECVCAGAVEELCGPLALGFEKSGLPEHDFLGEGCAMFSLEKESSAEKRSARVLGEIEAYDSRFHPDLQTGLAAGLTALTDAGVDLHDIPWAFVSPNAAVAKIQSDILSTHTSATVLDTVNQVVGECYSAQGAIQAAAVFADPQIEPGELALLSAAGVDGGVSHLVLRKR